MDRAFGGHRVLVADDDDAMRLLVTTMFETEGYEVGEAASGAELVRSFESSRTDAWPTDGVDLVVVDLRMPGMTGFDVIRAIRKKDARVPVILMTAFPEPSVIEEAQRLHVRILSKPFDLDCLTQAATDLLGEKENPR